MSAIYIPERSGSTWSPGLKALVAFFAGWIGAELLESLVNALAYPTWAFSSFKLFWANPFTFPLLAAGMLTITVYLASKPLKESFVKYTSEGKAIR